MSNDVTTTFQPGKIIYYVIVNHSGLIWNGLAFEVVDVTHWAQYAVAMTETDVPGVFHGFFPLAITIPDTYSLIAYWRSFGVPQITDQPVDSGTMIWDGHQEISGGVFIPRQSFETGQGANRNFTITVGQSVSSSGISITTGSEVLP